jgi:hypothetical protein
VGFNSMINRIPQKVTGRAGASSGNYQLQDNLYDFAIGGYPLLSATMDQRPDVEQPVEQRKNQFDNYKDPGEYSLSQWWLRSQSQFNGGAGIVYQDPDTQNTYLLTKNTRFSSSLGIDPFTDYSRIALLGETNLSTVYPSTLDSGFAYNSYVQGYTSSAGADGLWIARGHSVYVATIGTSDIAITRTVALATEAGQNSGITGGIAYTGGGTQGGNIVFVYQDQVASGQDGVWSVTEAGVATNIYAGDGTHLQKTIGFMKGQLLLASGNNLYQLNTTGARAVLPTPVAVAPQGQIITSMTAGPDAVYISANDGAQGYIYKTTYSTTPVTLINGLQQIAVLPMGEQINDIAFYVGTYLIIASDQGARVAAVSNTGLNYGPLIFTIPKKVGQTNGTKGIAFSGTLAFIGTYSSTAQHDGAWGTYCIDLGTVNTDNVTGFTTNAFTRWNYSPNTLEPVFDLTVSQTGRLIYTSIIPNSSNQSQLWVQHATNLITSGYLITGRCRFNTLEPKLFKFFSIRTPPLQGNLSVSLLDAGGGETSYITYNNVVTPGIGDIATPTPAGQQDWIALRFILNRNGSNAAVGAQMNGWQIKAMPGTIKQRMISKWFLCFNNESDKAGMRIGDNLYALNTLNQIRQMCQRGDTVNFQDLVNNVSTLVVIDTYQFVMMGPPGPNQENYGGYLKIDMRTVADTVPPLPPSSTAPVD